MALPLRSTRGVLVKKTWFAQLLLLLALMTPAVRAQPVVDFPVPDPAATIRAARDAQPLTDSTTSVTQTEGRDTSLDDAVIQAVATGMFNWTTGSLNCKSWQLSLARFNGIGSIFEPGVPFSTMLWQRIWFSARMPRTNLESLDIKKR
jgi:hypothetical protein